jgi:hypothetical protein
VGLHWYLGTIYVHFTPPRGRRPLSDDDLERVADALIALDDVATVRVEPPGRPSVVRVDVRAGAEDEAAALAARALEGVGGELGLDVTVDSVAVQ